MSKRRGKVGILKPLRTWRQLCIDANTCHTVAPGYKLRCL